MTNQEAINELQSAIDLVKQDGKDWLDERDIPILDMAIKAMEAQEWIPGKERLPEEETDVLVCNANGEIEISRGSHSTEMKNEFIWYTKWVEIRQSYCMEASARAIQGEK